MADTLLLASTAIVADVNAGNTDFSVILGFGGTSTDETTEQYLMHTPGRIYKVLFRIDQNDLDGATTITLRKNATNTGTSLTIPAGTTGDFEEDESVSETIADGDKVNFQIAAGGTSGDIHWRITRAIFTSDQDTITHNSTYTAAGMDTFSAASTTWYNVVNGGGDSVETTESNVLARIRRAGTFKNFVMNVSSNARATTTTARLRVNGANSSLSVSIGAGLSGFFSDTTNEQAVVPDDEVSFSLTTGTGAGDLVTNQFQTTFISPGDNNIGLYIAGNTDTDTNLIPQGVTRWWPVMGLLANHTSEDFLTIESALLQADWLEMTLNVTQNNLDNASTMRVRNNGQNVEPSVSIPANTTGIFSDISGNLTSSYPADNIVLQLTAGAGTVGDVIAISNTVIHAFLVSLKSSQLSMSAGNPIFEDYHDYTRQSSFFGNFNSPMFGD